MNLRYDVTAVEMFDDDDEHSGQLVRVRSHWRGLIDLLWHERVYARRGVVVDFDSRIVYDRFDAFSRGVSLVKIKLICKSCPYQYSVENLRPFSEEDDTTMCSLSERATPRAIRTFFSS